MSKITRRNAIRLIVVILAIPIALIWLGGYLTDLFWLPDFVFRQWEVVAQADEPEMGKATLVQKWRDDFYTTLLTRQ